MTYLITKLKNNKCMLAMVPLTPIVFRKVNIHLVKVKKLLNKMLYPMLLFRNSGKGFE